MANKRKKRGAQQRKPLFQSEIYSIQALHEDREYGMYWYAWLWKIVRPALIFLCSALMVVGMVSVGYKRIYNTFFAPVETGNAEVVNFQINSGETVTQIGERLQAANLLRDSRVFKYMVQFRGLTNALSYGTFKLSPGMNTDEIITELTSGSQTNERVITIVPGWTAEDIANYLVSEGALEDPGEFLRLCNDVDRFVGSSYALRDAQNTGTLKGRKYALEGYLAPDTYEIYTSAKADEIIRKLLSQTEAVFKTEYHDRADQLGMTMDQVITMASMIEKEAKNPDFAKVSAVFHNRLKKNMTLGSDVTVKYVSGVKRMALTDSDLQIASPYNTYLVKGLPLGPICSPSSAAIRAALYPDEQYVQDEYLYFCSKDPNTGELHFSRTLQEHELAVSIYAPLWQAYDREKGL